MSFLSPVNEVAQNLETNPNQNRIKKLIYFACKKEWFPDKTGLSSLYLPVLIQELRELNPTLSHLKHVLYGVVIKINKVTEYSLVADIITKEMEKLYIPYKQPTIKESISDDSNSYILQMAPIKREKLFVLELEDNNEKPGFQATLEILEANNRIPIRIVTGLPSALEILEIYEHWKSIYCSLDGNSRLEFTAKTVINIDSTEGMEQYFDSVQKLRSQLINWYNSEEFSPIREKLLEEVNENDEIRIIIRTHNTRLCQLPWNLVFEPFLNRYRLVELVFNILDINRIKSEAIPNKKVKLLSILGKADEGETEIYRKNMENLPDSELLLLSSPSREQISNQLWEQGWNIIFFSSHMSSPSETDRIYINETEILNIWALKYALTKAIVRGLKLAIFNFGDGLGLVRELASLQIPQIIVMREPVPDVVAQEFLKLFLKAFSGGKSLYAAVREARERLQPLETVFPGATWMPVICSNSDSVPLTWQDLRLPLKGFINRSK